MEFCSIGDVSQLFSHSHGFQLLIPPLCPGELLCLSEKVFHRLVSLNTWSPGWPCFRGV